ncbi:hypothetical protein PLICRDRAFT_666830 [Plicaturopsis crispa FD-325 SS-3]|uniref:Winged helix-turn helix domain-containing protein n=2 Tax=Plicaturopsis crispa FD-325 SS-3 TaxID=944288 RepID=A0A0C9SJX9_PLICR|nr:hypothetical protein PLICRDRAFT_666830 [Plicaturopsis crispa FD-325 SS-3]
MPFRKISRDVKLAAIKLYENDLLHLPDILNCCGFSERTWYRILNLWRTTGDVVGHRKRSTGRVRLLAHDDVQYLLRLVRQNPDYFLDELLHLLKTNRFISIHFTTIHNELVRAGVSLKKLKKVALERDEAGRAAFVQRMSQYLPEELGFLDETSKDERTLSRGLDGIVAGTVVEGSMTKVRFMEWLEFDVVRILVPSLSFLLTNNG